MYYVGDKLYKNDVVEWEGLSVGIALVYKIHIQGGGDNTAPLPHTISTRVYIACAHGIHLFLKFIDS